MAKRKKKGPAAKPITLEPVKKALARVKIRLETRKKTASPEDKQLIKRKLEQVKRLTKQTNDLCAGSTALIFRPPVGSRVTKKPR
jgi:hypothetical protein